MIIMPDADMDQAVDALIGAGYGSAGERCMAISVAVPVGEKTADALIEKLIPRVEKPEGRPVDRPRRPTTARWSPRRTATRVKGYIDIGVEEGAELVVDGRGFKLQGYENGFFMGGCLFDHVTPDMRHLQGRDLRAGAARSCAPRPTRRRWRWPSTTNTATASRSSPATATPRATSPPASMSAWSASTCRSRCRSPTTPSAAGSARPSATSTSTARTASASTPRPRPSPRAGRRGIKEGAEFSIPTMR